MAHTYTNLLTHVIFSTKDCAPLITASLHDDLLACLRGIVTRAWRRPKSCKHQRDFFRPFRGWGRVGMFCSHGSRRGLSRFGGTRCAGWRGTARGVAVAGRHDVAAATSSHAQTPKCRGLR
jgi:hypothetical protein